MLMLALLAAVVVAIPVSGGRLRRLASLELRRSWLLFLAIGAQVLIISVVPRGPHLLLAAVHVATYGLAAAWLWANRRMPGAALVTAGAASNGFAIAVNGGTLPASAAALRYAGLAAHPGEFVNSGALAHPRLAFLGDVFATPAWLPLHNVFSIGDALILLGAAYALHRITGSRLAGRQPSLTFTDASDPQPAALPAG